MTDISTGISTGAKNLAPLQGLSRVPLVAIAQKQAAPDQTAPGTMFETLKRFAPSDYVGWITQYIRYRFGRKHAFPAYANPADGIYRLDAGGGPIRLGLASDWGTGTDEAHRTGALIAAFEPHYTIHLGDVYFVGDPAEVAQNFLGQAPPGARHTPCRWPLGSKAAFALNGNHEMFARGFGYFDHLLTAMGEIKDGAAKGQPASYFCLLNDDWCILGLDTGYNSVGQPILEWVWPADAALPEPVVAWLQAIAPLIEGRAIIVLTHHQVLSVYDTSFTRQADQLFAIIQRPVLWFWGHEHRLVIYETFTAAGRPWPAITGRCIGHGGMPVDLPGTPKTGQIGTAAFVDPRPYVNDEGLHVGINGLVRLTLDGARLHIDYVDLFGQSVFEETFAAENGLPARQGFTNHQLANPALIASG